MEQKIIFDPCDWTGMLALMDEYGDSKFPFFGEDETGDAVMISINPDHITVETTQKNGWLRTNTYWRDGTIEEMYHKED